MPLYTHLYNLTADSLIGGNRLPRENHHPSTSNEKPFLLQTTDDVIIISPWRNGQGYLPSDNVLSRSSWDFEKNYPNKKCHVVLSKPIVLIYNMWGIISYLRVYPWALRLYHPEAILYCPRRSRRLYSGAEGWYNLNAHG